MASATGLPQRPPTHDAIVASEAEPLLGKPGDAVLHAGTSIMKSFAIGTAILAQLGIIILCADIWAHVFSNPLILFSGHPIAMSIAVFTLTQSVLVQQPISSETPQKKRLGQHIHAALNLFAFSAIVTGVTIIEVSKFRSHGPHFHSTHAFLGAFTLLVLVAQYVVGFTMWVTPRLYGGEERAKSFYKYHRYVGYFILVMLLVTVGSATETDYVQSVLGISISTAATACALVIIGVFPRIQKQKMGFGQSRPRRPVPDADGTTS
ncbi:hypothetical protein ED733_007101 [Metarhizium rileyi]|uniref:Cytochrome b561 domain-containing protein n=1 Tax=Metarhizium rileyi (strain RCEF 4871) TaxID=1649241 RepID=A0A5C6GP69_METRR|nr:hypothetical protein ED733_007101 [Metarhizium rileyi]